MKILDAIAPFDDVNRKHFYFSQIKEMLDSVDKTEKSKPEFEYEMVAMELVPAQEDNPWGTYYYGPKSTSKDEEGRPIYFPSLSDITSDSVLYWEQRAEKCKNPLLIARYADLAWDFNKKITKDQRRTLYRLLVDNLLLVCNEDYCSYPIITVMELEHLFALTKNSPADLQLTKKAYIEFEKLHAKDDAVRFWASRFILMINYRKFFDDNEKLALVNEHEERLKRLQIPDGEERLNPWLIERQASLLATYYNSINKKDDVKRVLNITEKSFESENKNMNALQLMGNLQRVYQEYRQYGLMEDAKALSVKIQSLGENVTKEMTSIQTEFTIPEEVIKLADEEFGERAESEEIRWRNFVIRFIPRKEEEERSLKKLVEKYPITFMMGNNLLDPKGHPMSYIGPYDIDTDSQLMLFVAKKMNIQSYYLSLAIHNLLKTRTLTVENMMSSMIIPSPIFEEDRYDIIRESIKFFIEGNYVIFSHLIIPQIENAIRNLVERYGVPVLKPQKNNVGYQYRTLDELLREKCIERAFSSDGAWYLQLVLTNQKALNIRNLLCHGILQPANFGFGTAGRLLHVLIMLGRVRLYNA